MANLNNNGSWWCEVTNNNELVTIITISLPILAIIWYKLTFSYSSPSLPPGPYSLPIIGYLPFLGHEIHKQFTMMANTYGPIFKFYIGSTAHVVINNIDLLKEVVRDEDETFANHKLTVAAKISLYDGEDVGFSPNWRYLKKIFSHEVLSNKNLEACASLRRYQVRKTIKNLYRKIGTEVDFGEVGFRIVMNVVISMITGDTSDAGEPDMKQMAELKMVAEKISEYLGTPNMSDFFPSLAWFDIQGIEKGVKKQHKTLDRIFTNIIDERIKFDSNGVGHNEKTDFLQVLLDLKNQNKINDTQMRGLMMDIMLGATETTSSLLEWAMAELLRNPEVMKRVQDELMQVVGANNIVEESHLSKLVYLKATIKETLRLHPLSPLLAPRMPNKDCVIGGYTIPKGSRVFLNVYAIQRDPRYWNNPLDFNPERFLQLEGTEKFDMNGNNMKFLPFGSGRRVCPGISLADKMYVYILASFLHSFNWSLRNGEKVDLSEKVTATLNKKEPLMVIPSQKLLNASLYM